jgi:predicted nucleic acid-binding protein
MSTLLKQSKMIFVDTSAFLAMLSVGDLNHQRASQCWRNLLEESQALFTDNYVIVESIALIQKRLGLEKLHQFQEKIMSLLDIEWVGEEQHNTAIEAVLTANQRNLSLVDCLAFETMRRLDIEIAFTFDEHFREQGFNVIP